MNRPAFRCLTNATLTLILVSRNMQRFSLSIAVKTTEIQLKSTFKEFALYILLDYFPINCLKALEAPHY